MYGADVEQVAIELNEDPEKLAAFEARIAPPLSFRARAFSAASFAALPDEESLL